MLFILAGLCLVISAHTSAEAKEFKTDSYSVDVPNGCKTESQENRFSDDARFDCKAGYGFQFTLEGSPYTGTDEELPDQLLRVIEGIWYPIEEVERGTDKYIINNQTAPYVQATYEQTFTIYFGLPSDSQDWGYMVVGIKMDDDMLYAHYKNDQNNFDKELKVCDKVLKSIEVKKSGSSSNSSNQTAVV